MDISRIGWLVHLRWSEGQPAGNNRLKLTQGVARCTQLEAKNTKKYHIPELYDNIRYFCNWDYETEIS